MVNHMGIWVVVGLIILIVGTITSVKTILKIYGNNISNEEISEDDSDDNNNVNKENK